MKPVPSRKARAAALSKGFVKKPNGDHEYYFFHYQGKMTVWRIKISHGARDMEPHEIRKDAMVCQMPASDLEKVLSCSHDKAWVEGHYRKMNGSLQGR